MLRGNGIYKIVSVLIAIALSIYVHSERNPSGDRLLTLALSAENSERGVLVQDMPKTVQVQLSGPQSAVLQVTTRDLVAAVNLKGRRPGKHDMKVVVSPAPGALVPPEVSISAVELSVPVVLEAASRQSRPLEPVFLRPAPVGFSYGLPSVQPPAATVTGPRKSVSRVARLQVLVDTQASGDGPIAGKFPIQAVNAVGDEVEDVTVRPSSAAVRCDIQRMPTEKEILISASITGSPAGGYRIVSVSVVPQSVVVTGGSDVLSRLNFALTEAVDIAGATANVGRTVPVVLPSGVIARGPRRARVEVTIAPRGA